MRKSQVIILLLILGMVVAGFCDPDINHNYDGDYRIINGAMEGGDPNSTCATSWNKGSSTNNDIIIG